MCIRDRVSPADWAAPAGQAAPVGGDLGRPWAATAVSAAAPIDDRPHGVVVSRVRRAFSTLSSGETAGLVVDVALLVVWLLFMAVLIAMPFTPDERYATWPFWLLAFQYWTFGIPFFTGFLFILTDVRVLRREMCIRDRPRASQPVPWRRPRPPRRSRASRPSCLHTPPGRLPSRSQIGRAHV